MNVIDFRFRPNTPEILDGIQNSTMFKGLCKHIDFSKMKPQTVAECVRDLTAHNVVRAVITGRDCETTYNGSKHNNQSIMNWIQQFPEKFIGFFGMDPHKGMKGIASLVTAVETYGMRGAAIDPYLAQLYPNDAKYYPIYSKCCELNIPIVFTTGPATLVPGAVIDHVAPRYIDFVARDFPDLKIVISHGGYPWVNEAIIVTERNANVYLDISEFEASPMSEAYVQAANSMIADKLLYASAHPFIDFRDALATYGALPISAEARQKIMHDNAAKLLGIETVAPAVAPAAPAAPAYNASSNASTADLVRSIVAEVVARQNG